MIKQPKSKIKLVVLATILVGIIGFVSLQVYYDKSPQGLISAIVGKISRTFSSQTSDYPVNQFSPENKGILTALDSANPIAQDITPEEVAEVFGIHWNPGEADIEVVRNSYEQKTRSGITYKHGTFLGYDEVAIPFYEFYPPVFDTTKKYPALVLFSGHGNMDELAFYPESYQKAAAVELAREGFVVYTMENRGMGLLSYLGEHERIDAVARLTGGSWYGEIVTDGLYLLNYVFDVPYVDAGRVGVGGVSSGGALSMLTSAIDSRISATYVQGYLGSYKTTFGPRANHCTCNNIAGILNHFDMHDIAALISPRQLLFVNGEEDGFYYQDAEESFTFIREAYRKDNAIDNVSLETPEGTPHEFSISIAHRFFSNTLLK